jgi:large subunit ribosomal protein L25
MSTSFKLTVGKREIFGKQDIKRMRKEDKIPGVYYSHDSKESIPFFITTQDLHEAFKSGSMIYQVSVGGKLRNVLLKEIQYHPVSDKILHIDLFGVKMDEMIDIKVPLHLVGECIGEKTDGGNLSQALMELDIKCMANAIPSVIEVDVTELKMNESIHAGVVQLPEGVELGIGEDVVIASVGHGISDKDLETATEEDEDLSFEDTEGTDSEDGTEESTEA